MNIAKYVGAGVGAMLVATAFAQDNPNWLRYPSISPDGKTIAFCYQGDLFLVPSTGGKAVQLTTHPAYDSRPIWSPDSQTIAFSSTRDGGTDLYTLPVSGGQPKRLTTFSSTVIPNTFSADGKSVIFNCAITPDKDYGEFPYASQVYSVPVNGGRPTQFLSFEAHSIDFNKAGDKMIYHDRKGYEDEWRKHHTSSICRDVWMRDLKTGEFTNLSKKQVEDRYPVFSADENTIYFLSERFGDFNVCAMSTSKPTDIKPLTSFEKHPVRFLTRSDADTLCFLFDGGIYTMQPNTEAQRLTVEIVNDNPEQEVKKLQMGDKASEIAISPDGKEFAMIIRGDVFVANTEFGTTKRITNTAAPEMDVKFAPDGRAVVYSSHRDGQWNIYTASLSNKYDKGFAYSTEIEEKQLTQGLQSCFQPSYSPTGKEIAYLRERTEIVVMDLESKESRVVLPAKYNYSYTDGDQSYEWSPDGKWILASYFEKGGWHNPDIAIINADGKGEIHNLTNSGYSDSNARWAMDGKAVIWSTDRQGMRSHGSWGSQNDVYGLFLDDESFNHFKLSKEERAIEAAMKAKELAEELDEAKAKAEDSKKALAEATAKAEAAKKAVEDPQAAASEELKASACAAQKALEEATKLDEEAQKLVATLQAKAKGDKKPEATAKKDADEADKKPDLPELKFNFDNLDDRMLRLTINSSNLGDAVLTKDGKKLYYLASFEKGGDLWVHDFEEKSTKLLSKLGKNGSLELSADGKSLFLLSGGNISTINTADGKLKTHKYNAEFELKTAAEREALFNYVYQQVADKYFTKDFWGVDWKFYGDYYRSFLSSINNNADYSELLSEMLGELNASHTGGRFGWGIHRPETASLGAFYDESYLGDGLKIAEIMKQGPLTVPSTIKAGMIIEQIDGNAIKAGEDYFPLLEGKAGKRLQLSIYDPEKNVRFTEFVKPISYGAQRGLLYKRWMDQRAAMVEELSGGRLGYIHVAGMNTESFQKTYSKLLGKYRNCDAIVIDTRFNGGGWLHGDLANLLNGVKYAEFVPRGQFIGEEPFNQWSKPSAVLACEGNYSDAHGFPWVYTELKVGTLVGAPIPGTMTAVWWDKMMNGVTFGIPQVAIKDNQGRILENLQLEPNIEVYNAPAESMKNYDAQLQAAVKHLLEQL